MQRKSFVASLASAAALAPLLHAAPASAMDERAVGRQVFDQLRDAGDMLFDSPFYEHLNEVGRVIAVTVTDRYPDPIRYFIVKGESANAFSVPGGNIYVNEPLLRLAKNRDELAGVLAHETGHMVLHHVARHEKQAKPGAIAATIGTIIGAILGGQVGAMGADYILGNLYGASDANISRHIEAEADEEGARIMAATGQFNPWGLIWFFETMTATYGKGQANYLTDHPLDDVRINGLKQLFARDVATFGKYTDTKQRDIAYW